MKSLEVSGKTVEEAVQNALARLGVSREDIKVTVLKEGRHGILGLGTEEARIRVELKEPDLSGTLPQNEGVADIATEVIEHLISLLEVPAFVILEEEVSAEATPSLSFDLKGQDLGILIGRRGQTLASLQYIVRLIMAHRLNRLVSLTIDVGGYKKRRYDSLRSLALRLAEQVKVSGMPFTLEPMPPDERRVIHLALAHQPKVTTKSTGEGEDRKVVILPA